MIAYAADRETGRRGRAVRRAAFAPLLLLAAALGACGESGGPPTQVPVPPDEPVEPRPSHVPPPVMYDSVYTAALITCNVAMSPLAVTCGSPQIPAGTVSPNTGGRGVHVQMKPTSPVYNGTSKVLSMNVVFQNWLVNQIGTADGPTLSGLLAFLTAAPTTTGGSGAVTVNTPDSIGTFTAPNQPYFFYNQKLGWKQTSAARQWKFNVPTGVTAFQFKVYVSAPILPVIVFDKEVASERHVYRVALDGSDLVQLSTTGAPNLDPTAARNTVVYVSYRSGQAELYSVPLSGGAQPRLTISTTINETAPALSLDGQKLAFLSDVSGVTKLWTANADATGQAPLTAAFSHPGAIENSPSWDRSARVAFTTTLGATADVWTVVPGSAPVAFAGANSPTAQDVELAFSHNGVRSAWATDRDGDTEVYWRQSGLARMTTRAGIDAQPTFLSDGKIVYVEDGPTPVLRWQTITAGGNLGPSGIIPVGPGVPGNPQGVPLF